MKNLFIKMSLVVFFGMFLLLSSCAKKNSSAQNRGAGAPRGDAAAPTTTLGVAKCADGSHVTGRIFDDQMTGNIFRNNWSNFFSAIMADNQLGDLSGASNSTQTGVDIELKLKIVNNAIDKSQTKLTFVVKDSLVGTKNAENGEIYQTITASFSSATNATLSNVNNGSGQFQLTFQDAYGEVTVNGTFNQSRAQGTVSFVNSKHYNNETPKSGNLGTFSVNSFGLFY
jgi:hypothetical protein